MTKIITSERLIIALLMIGLLWALWWGACRALDGAIDRQNIMLCKSARVSGIEKWLDRCQEYYKTGEYTYLRDLL